MDNQTRVFRKDEVIFREGVYERCMYDIRSGSVRIYVNYGASGEMLMTTLEAGQFFGEIGITEKRTRTATAVAGENGAELSVITAESFASYFHREHHRILAVMRQMSHRVRTLTQEYMDARKAITEAVDSARRGEKKSAGLANVLSKLVQNAFAPAFLNAGKAFDEADFMQKNAGQEVLSRSFKKNEVIFREGDPAGCMYDIRQGSVGIYAEYETDQKKLLAELKAEECFGEMGLLENLPRSATAVALESGTELQMISEESFGRYFSESPQKIIAIMSQLSGRIRALTADYMKVCQYAAEAAEAAKDEKEDAYWRDLTLDYHYEEYSPYNNPMVFFRDICKW